MEKGYYHVTDPREQIKVDIKAADTVLNKNPFQIKFLTNTYKVPFYYGIHIVLLC